MPTETGLRLFVDAMMQVAEPTREEREAIEQRLGDARDPIERALEETSALLSDLSGAAGMVMVPTREPRLAQVSLTAFDAHRVLAVLVGEDGHIENRILAMPPDALTRRSNRRATTSPPAVRAGRWPKRRGRWKRRSPAGVRRWTKPAAIWCSAASRSWSEDATNRPVLIVRGQSNLLDEAALGDIERVRSLLDDLESKQSVATLLERARQADAMRIFIGSENRLFSLSGSSVIASPYRDREGRVVGVLGVIGPTRLNYARVVPMVDFTARSLGKREIWLTGFLRERREQERTAGQGGRCRSGARNGRRARTSQ